MSLSMVLPPMYPRSPPTAGRNLEISQPGKNLPTNLNQFIQPLLQVPAVKSSDEFAKEKTLPVKKREGSL